MSYKLKLDIYNFQLKKITSIEDDSSSGKRKKIKTEKDACPFSTFFTGLGIQDAQENPLHILLDNLIAHFDGKFERNDTNTHCVSISSDDFNGFSSSTNTIWGNFKGGLTGIKRNVYDGDDSSNVKSEILENDVAAVEYFFLLWIPNDSNCGILMVQSYREMGSLATFKDSINDFFITLGYKPLWAKIIPQNYIDDFIRTGAFNKIKIVHAKKFSNENFDADFTTFKESKLTSILENFTIPLRTLINNGTNMIQSVKSQIRVAVPDYDSEEDSVTLYYKDGMGKSANARLTDIERILPVIELDDSLMEDNHPIWDDLKSFAVSLLENIKTQIGYTPQRVE